MPSKLSSLAWCLRLNGLAGTARVAGSFLKRRVLRRPVDAQYCIARDAQFDRNFGIETAAIVEVDALDVPDDLKRHSVEYRPTSSVAAAQTIDSLPINKPDYHLIDIGCGKGRVVVIASMMPFAGVTGIELSPRLANQARQNLRSVESRRKARSVDIVEGDATEANFPDQPLVVYLFNPFDGPLVDKLRLRLEENLKEHPRDCWVVYANAVHGDLFNDASCWQREHHEDPWWAVYRWIATSP